MEIKEYMDNILKEREITLTFGLTPTSIDPVPLIDAGKGKPTHLMKVDVALKMVDEQGDQEVCIASCHIGIDQETLDKAKEEQAEGMASSLVQAIRRDLQELVLEGVLGKDFDTIMEEHREEQSGPEAPPSSD